MKLSKLSQTTNVSKGVARVALGLVQGVLVAVLAALTGSVLVSSIIALANLEADLNTIFRVFHYLSMGLGALYGARYIRRMGWFTGLIVAVVYLIMLTWWVDGNLTFLTELSSPWLIQVGIASAIGIVGGIVGVNLVSDF